MNSREYWKEREAENLAKNLKSEEAYAKTLQGYYDYMMDQVQKEISGFYVKYANKEGITMAEAKKRVSKLDIAEYGRKAAKYVKDKDLSAQANEEMRLYNATMKINRLEMLKANIGLEMVVGFDELQKFFDTVLTDRTLSEFERQSGILGNTIQNNAQMAHAIVNASFNNARYSDRVWMYQGMMKSELSKLLQTGLIQGKNPRELARHLTKLFGVQKSNAERLMRTELARVQTEAQRQSFERNGYEQYEFIALGNACDVCRALNGKHFDVKKMMPGENAPPMHPNCRCSTSTYMDREEFEKWLENQGKGDTTEEWNHSKNIYEKEESKNKNLVKETVINEKLIESIKYSDKFKQLGENESIVKNIRKASINMIKHRSGTEFEDIAYIDTVSGKTKVNKSYNVMRESKPSKDMNKLLSRAEKKTVVGVHTHPNSQVPSMSDFYACEKREYKYGIAACHDGTLYKYKTVGELNEPMLESALDLLSEMKYYKGKDYDNKYEKILAIFKDGGIEMEVL